MSQPRFDTAQLPADAVEVGRVGEAWGIKGWVKIWSYSPQSQALINTKHWYLQVGPSKLNSQAISAKVKAGPPTLPTSSLPDNSLVNLEPGVYLPEITQVKLNHTDIVVHFSGINTREQAQQLRGVAIYVARSDFPKLEKDEYYWVDLIGLEVVNLTQQKLGVVQDLSTNSAQNLLVIEPEPQIAKIRNSKHTIMIPFVNNFIIDVDLVKQQIVVDWQADY